MKKERTHTRFRRMISVVTITALFFVCIFPVTGSRPYVFADEAESAGQSAQAEAESVGKEQEPEAPKAESAAQDVQPEEVTAEQSPAPKAEEESTEENVRAETEMQSASKEISRTARTRKRAPKANASGTYYYVTINVTREDDSPISNPAILFERLHTSYASSMTQRIQPENGKYKVDCGEGFAVCYIEVSAEGYDKKTLNLDPREMMDLNENNEGSITVKLKKAKDTSVKRNLTFQVIDSMGRQISGATLVLERNSRGYVYDEVAPTSGMNYTVAEMGNNGADFYWQYRFRASAAGYVSVTGEDFSFRSRYYNSYFDPATTDDPIVIRVMLKSNQEVLEEARASAIEQLKRHKDRSSYRAAEQQEYDRIIVEFTGKIQSAADQNAVNKALSDGKTRLDALKTAAEYENEELVKSIFFRSTNAGKDITADEDGVFTITDTDSGNFYFRKPDGGTYLNNTYETRWRCEVEIHTGSTISWNYIIGAYGQYQPRVLGGPYDATVQVRALNKTVHFKVKVVKEKIDRLRALVDGKDVSGGTIHVTGSEGKCAVIQGHVQGTEVWRTLPINAVEFTCGGAVSVNHASGVFKAWGATGSMTYSLTTDPDVKVSFDVISDPVPVQRISVSAPSVYYIDLWDTVSGDNVGILEGDEGEKDRYHVSVFPSNATNPAVTWTALTPDIATQSDIHSVGIVPRKAGVAEFLVTSVDNPKVSSTVSITFKFKNALRSAKPDQSVYYMSPGETKTFTIVTNDQYDSAKGATEQRFHWSYSTSGIASVTDKVSASGKVKSFSHQIHAENEGVVYVTGAPYDTSEGCPPVRFKVIVTENAGSDRAAAKGVEDLINSIGEVTLDKKDLVENARKAFDRLTAVQKDMVDDEIYAKLQAAELKIRQLEREKKKEESSGGKNSDADNSKDHGNVGAGSASDNSGGAPGGGNPGDGGEPGDAAEASGKTAATKTSDKAASKDIRKAASKSQRARGNKGEAENSLLMREAAIEKVVEDAKDVITAPDVRTALLLFAFLVCALVYGARRKYREFRQEIR